MAGTQAIVEMSAQDRGLLDMQKAVTKGFDVMVEKLTKVETQSAKTQKTAEKTFDSMAVGAGKAVMSFVGVNSMLAATSMALRLVASDYERVNQQIERSRQAAVTAAGGQLQAALSFTPDASMGSFKDVDKQVKEISKRIGMPIKDVYPLASAALGDRGRLSNAEAMTAVESSLRLTAGATPEDRTFVTRGMLDLMNTAGVDADTAKGVIIQGAAEHKVGLGEYSKHVVPAIKSVINMGGSLEEGASLTSGMANAMGDKFGRESSTGSESLTRQVFEATERFPEMRGKGLFERVQFMNEDERGIRIRLGLNGVFDKDAVKYGRTRPGSLTGPEGGLATMRSILNMQGEGWEQVQDARRNAVNKDTAAGIVAAKEAEIGGLDFQKIAAADRERERLVEEKQLKGGRARQGAGNLTFEQLLAEQNLRYPDRYAAETSYFLKTQVQGKDRFTAGAETFEELANSGGYRGMMASGKNQGNTPEAESLREAARSLREIADKLNVPQPAPNGERRELPGAAK